MPHAANNRTLNGGFQRASLSALNSTLPKPDSAVEDRETLLRYFSTEEARIKCLKTFACQQSIDTLSPLSYPTPPYATVGIALRLDRRKLTELYDPRLPTIALMHPSGVAGGALVAAAAHASRTVGTPLANVILAPAIPGVIQFTEHALTLAGGVLVDRFGAVYYGEFDTPITVQIVHPALLGRSFEKCCQERSIPLLSSVEGREELTNKALTKNVLTMLGIPTPSGLALTRAESTRATRAATVATFIAAHANALGYVVKPVDEGQGRSVQIIPCTHVSRIPAVIEELLKTHRSVLLEEQFPSACLASGEGESQAVCLRVLASYRGTVDIEARVGPATQPVNKCRGAVIREFDNTLYNAFATRTIMPTLDDVRRSIDGISVKLARYFDTALLGYDVIINPRGELTVIEVGAENVGGLSSLAEVRKRSGEKLRAPTDLLHAWICKCSSHGVQSAHTPQRTTLFEPDTAFLAAITPLLCYNSLATPDAIVRIARIERLLLSERHHLPLKRLSQGYGAVLRSYAALGYWDAMRRCCNSAIRSGVVLPLQLLQDFPELIEEAPTHVQKEIATTLSDQVALLSNQPAPHTAEELAWTRFRDSASFGAILGDSRAAIVAGRIALGEGRYREGVNLLSRHLPDFFESHTVSERPLLFVAAHDLANAYLALGDREMAARTLRLAATLIATAAA